MQRTRYMMNVQSLPLATLLHGRADVSAVLLGAYYCNPVNINAGTTYLGVLGVDSDVAGLTHHQTEAYAAPLPLYDGLLVSLVRSCWDIVLSVSQRSVA